MCILERANVWNLNYWYKSTQHSQIEVNPDGTELPHLLKPVSTSGGVLRQYGRRRRQSGESFVDSCTVAYLVENVDLATTLLLDVTKVLRS